MKDLRIIFMGTPEFAVESLKKLVENKFKVVGVITATDKPKGRGRKLAPSPVKEYALTQNISVLQPKNLKAPEFAEELKSYNPNLFVVVAFRMLPEVIWSIPEYGTFNLHASLLPQYRGAAPINWAVINGEKETGVTTFFIKHEIDTGSIIFKEKEPIHEDDDAGSVYERLMHKGADLVVKTVTAIQKGEYELSPQVEEGELKHAPKIFKEDCEIDWSANAETIRNFVRGLSPYPAAWTKFNDLQYKIYKIEITDEDSSLVPGAFESDDKSYIKVNTGSKKIRILDLQVQGKKRMEVEEFLRGNKI